MKKKSLKILLVEDEQDAVQSITNVLIRREFEVLSTGSGKKAIEIVKKSKPDLVLLDLSLEDITGIEALEQIRDFDKSLKVMIVTGSVLMTEDREKVFGLGVHKFLSKPSTSDQLLEAIDIALDSEKYLSLSEFPVWQFEPGRALNSRHELKGILGSLNMQCANFLSDIDSKRMRDLDDHEKTAIVLEQLKDIHEKIKKACEVINKEIV